MRRVVASIALAGTVALAAVVSYEVEPRTAAWAGKVSGDPQYGGVGQGFVACFDSIEAVHLFIGHNEGEAEYVVNIGEPGGPPVMSSFPVEPANGHDWAVFDSWQTEARFTKGKTYIATFTRTSGPDSLMYYYDSTDAYGWGQIVLPGQQAPIPDPRACVALA